MSLEQAAAPASADRRSGALTLPELEQYLARAADLLRGSIDQADFKAYIFPLMFFKRISDVYIEEFEQALDESAGDHEFAAFAENHRFAIPAGNLWSNVRDKTENIGSALQAAFREIEKANPETLYGIFGNASWTNKDKLPDRKLADLIEHFSTKTLSNANVAPDVFGNAYEYLIKRFADQSMFTARYADPYAQSHPMPTERIAALTEIARSSPNWEKKDSPELQARHEMMRAKLSGFMEPPQTVARRYPLSDTSLPARYARAISTYRHSDLRAAIAQIDSLIAIQPNNPYFYELKGQALLEGSRPAEAIAPLRHAAQIAPHPTLIQLMLGQALVATNDPRHADEAITILRNALAREPDAPQAYQQLAMAYGRKGDVAQADLASAQAAFSRGDIKTARELAARAKTRLRVGSPGWVRADDIVATKMPNLPNRPN